MLNEGVHVDGISGVIMFRPTVSPIIYKQQIGRALSAGSKKSTVILDIVDNISGLYSIGAIEEEIKEAVDYYNYLGESSYIVNDKFKIIDEVWENGFLHAIRYAETADINSVKQSYCSPDGYKLGEWLRGQKRQYPKGKLGAERQARLENIGMFFQ